MLEVLPMTYLVTDRLTFLILGLSVHFFRPHFDNQSTLEFLYFMFFNDIVSRLPVADSLNNAGRDDLLASYYRSWNYRTTTDMNADGEVTKKIARS